LTAEDRIHVALMLALGAANLALFASGPFEGALPPAQAAQLAVSESPSEAHRSELDAAIGRLEAWLARARAQAAAGEESQIALQGLGPTPEDRAHPERWLTRLLGPENSNAWLAPTDPAAPAPAAARRALTAALVILLESGVPLQQQLSAPSAEKAPALRLCDLVQRSLDSAATSLEAAVDAEPWQLDLLSLAVLGGLQQYRDRLAHATQRMLRQLDHAQRSQATHPGSGELDAAQLVQLASTWREQAATEVPGALDLHCSAAVFRATAVLSDQDLELQARRHLQGLLAHFRSDHALYRYLEATASNASERGSVRRKAIEHLGRLEEALYNAHLSFRSDADSAPSAATGQVMRLAARDLIDRLQDLDAGADESGSAAARHAREELLRAAVHALRGLRTARVAG
jgi:hypothetical protein